MEKMKSIIDNILIGLSLIVMIVCLWSCSDDSDEHDACLGKPLEFNAIIQDERSDTRSSALPTSDEIFITADEGNNWCKYTYDSDTQTWKPATGQTPIVWTEPTMTIFAIVRHDGGSTGAAVTINADQSTSANYYASDFLGARETYSYTSGKIDLVLKHRVSKLTVIARNSPASDLACTTTLALPTSGTFTLGYSDVDFSSNAETTSTIKLFQEGYDTSNKIAYFSAYLFPQVGLKTGFVFTSGGKSITITVEYNLNDFGVALDNGCITRYDITLPAKS